METVNNIAAAASKAIWGEQNTTTEGEKQVSTYNETRGSVLLPGVQGDVQSNEPFNKGNTETTNSGLPVRSKETTTSGSNTETTKPPFNPETAAVGTKPDTTGITHPKTFESSPTTTTTDPSKPSSSEPTSAATLQSKTSTPATTSSPSTNPETSAPSTAPSGSTSGPETHKKSHEPRSAAEEDAKIAKKPRKDHETTTREIKATQEKAMAGTHPAEKEGEALREKDDTEEKGKGPDSLTEHKSHHHEAGDGEVEGKEKVSLKDKLMAKVHKH